MCTGKMDKIIQHVRFSPYFFRQDTSYTGSIWVRFYIVLMQRKKTEVLAQENIENQSFQVPILLLFLVTY